MTTWLLKTEPGTYAYADLARDGKTRWDGVTNPVALKNIRRMAKGDPAFIYHTGDEKAVVGLARIASAPYLDPKDEGGKLAVVDLTPERPLKRPVTLAAVKADPAFADFALVRIPRLSVLEVPPALAKRLLKLGGG
ncbi:MAG: EVE domain-containing protein [Thermoanaerobaculia bacterium]